jgi:hypothetical protein
MKASSQRFKEAEEGGETSVKKKARGTSREREMSVGVDQFFYFYVPDLVIWPVIYMRIPTATFLV